MRVVKKNKKMQREEDESLISYLKQELTFALVTNESLEKENKKLRQEVLQLKSQISALKANKNEGESMFWKKFHSTNCTKKADTSQEKSSPLENPTSRNRQELEATKKAFRPTKPLPPSPIPPPPPMPSKIAGSNSVRRVPDVIQFYRLLSRKDTQIENRENSASGPIALFPNNMIGEIENRSTYLSAIKSDVRNRKELIELLIKEVDSADFKNISHVEEFVKFLDDKLSLLVDERAVLKHFPWPERKADALREAAFYYRDMRSLESEASSFVDNQKESLTQALARIQALQDRLERSVDNIERIREGTIIKYRELHIPWEWLQPTGLVGQMKVSSLKLAKEHMKRIIKELPMNRCSMKENLLLQGARFAYRVHQFAGGFDTEAIHAFQELKRIGIDTKQ